MFVHDTKDDLISLHLPSKKCCENSYIHAHKVTDVIDTDNFACDDCKKYFLRGIFLMYGTITDPDKSYHLELILPNETLANSLMDLLSNDGLTPKKTVRKNNYILYYKESDIIVDFLNIIGANKSAFRIMNVRIEKEIRNNTNRLVNCDTANIDKTVSAAIYQIDAINTLITTGEINNLPNELRETAYLRLNNPDITLNELAELHNPPISKSGVDYRLRKLTSISRNRR